jgi:hypothetical protein
MPKLTHIECLAVGWVIEHWCNEIANGLQTKKHNWGASPFNACQWLWAHQNLAAKLQGIARWCPQLCSLVCKQY